MYPHKKIWGYNNLRIRVDGALVVIYRGAWACKSEMAKTAGKLWNTQSLKSQTQETWFVALGANNNGLKERGRNVATRLSGYVATWLLKWLLF